MFMQEEAKKWLARTIFGVFTIVIITAFTPVGEKIKAIWRTPESIQSIETKIDDISSVLGRLTGESRIIRQPPGMSYVKEPVIAGDDLTIVLYVQRTELGANCQSKEVIPQFTDENGVQRPGTAFPPRRQLGTAVVRRELVVPQVDGLIPGRTQVQLQIEFLCNDKTFFELTEPLYYYVQEG